MPRADRFAQRHDSARWRVFRLVALDGCNRSFLDVVWSRKVRLARAKVGDVHALRFQPISFSDDRRCRRDLYAVDAFRKLQCSLLWDRLQPVSWTLLAPSNQALKMFYKTIKPSPVAAAPLPVAPGPSKVRQAVQSLAQASNLNSYTIRPAT